MPRLRRAARERRLRLRLERAIWEWLKAGRPTFPRGVPNGAACSVLMIEIAPIHHWKKFWRLEFNDETNGRSGVDVFWEIVAQKVNAGLIEIVEDFDNAMLDQVFVTEEEAIEFVQQHNSPTPVA